MSRTGGLAITTMGLVAFLAAFVALLAWRNGPASAQVSPQQRAPPSS